MIRSGLSIPSWMARGEIGYAKAFCKRTASLPITEGRRFAKGEASTKRHPIYESLEPLSHGNNRKRRSVCYRSQASRRI